MIRLTAPLLWKGALGASVALNLVLGALLLRDGPDRPPGGPGIRQLESRIERILSPRDAEAFRQAMETGRLDWEAARRAMRESRPALETLIRQEPFDPAAMRAAMAAGRAGWAAFSAAFEDSLVRGVAAVSPEGRRRIADDMARGPGPRRGGRDDGPPPGPPPGPAVAPSGAAPQAALVPPPPAGPGGRAGDARP
ncbi:periplasmic heavy metal sensor [Roseomonas sp. OT10]|uniref:periplasmic heavy metal sensor n=1 Tax=Roseomonas cutis TaxID=2897332 RepID=UPI001E45EA95|nr:periplasmic heavy metal sensor [Roseomonas sp. OT10]UFN47839.1 periplasmic heavy metal sensor [Roseomonas sp. OT10]